MYRVTCSYTILAYKILYSVEKTCITHEINKDNIYISDTQMHTLCPVQGDMVSKLDPAGVKGHISPESWTMWTLGTGPCCTNTLTLITQQTMFALPPLQFPPFIKGFTVRGWEKLFGWTCVFISLPWACPIPMWSGVSNWFCGGGLWEP